MKQPEADKAEWKLAEVLSEYKARGLRVKERYERLQVMKRAGGKVDLKLMILDLQARLEREEAK